MRYNSTSTKTAISKKRDNNKCLEDEKKMKLSYTARGNAKKAHHFGKQSQVVKHRPTI